MHRVIGVGIYTGKETIDVLGSWTHNTSQGWQARTTSTSILPLLFEFTNRFQYGFFFSSNYFNCTYITFLLVAFIL